MKTDRRNFLQKTALLTAAGLSTPLYSFNILTPRKMKYAEPIGHGEFRYKVDKDWGVQDPAKVPVKDCHEMVQDSQGRLILLTNETKNNVLIYNADGKVIKTWGGQFPGAHGLTLSDEGGEEFLWVTDHDRHQVFKMTLDGKEVMKLDYPRESGVYDHPGQYKPTETAIAPNGDIFVADGYGLSYVIQYNAKGEYIRHFGGKGDGKENLSTAHGVIVDTRDAGNPSLVVSSRSTQQYKKYSMEGKHLETIDLPGAWVCRPVIKGDYLYTAVIVSNSWDYYDGFVAILDKDFKVVSAPGGNEPVYQNGKLQPLSTNGLVFMNPHDVCIDNDLNIYVPQWNSGKTYPVKLERV